MPRVTLSTKESAATAGLCSSNKGSISPTASMKEQAAFSRWSCNNPTGAIVTKSWLEHLSLDINFYILDLGHFSLGRHAAIGILTVNEHPD